VVPWACPWGSTGVTDNDWFEFLSQQPGIDEFNFWQFGGMSELKSLGQQRPVQNFL